MQPAMWKPSGALSRTEKNRLSKRFRKQDCLSGFHASSQPTHVDQEVQFFLEVNIPLNIGSRSVQMRGRHSAVKIHMNDRMHALLLASGKLSRQRILLDSDALNRHTSKRRVSIHHQAVGWSYPPW